MSDPLFASVIMLVEATHDRAKVIDTSTSAGPSYVWARREISYELRSPSTGDQMTLTLVTTGLTPLKIGQSVRVTVEVA